MRIMRHAPGLGIPTLVALGCLLGGPLRAEDLWVVYDGFDGPGQGKHVVLVSGDDE